MTGPRVGSLCSGYGGLERGLQDVLGGDVAWHAEIDPAASKLLAYRHPGVPNHGDITAIDWATVEPVDYLTAGFPCQDVSLAGARKGMRAGTRSGIWSHVAEAIDHLRPRLVLLENVRGLLSAGADSDLEPCAWCLGDAGSQHALRALGAVLGDLVSLGYDTRRVGLRAADVGAPHGRYRIFIAAWPAEDAHGAVGGEWRVAAPGQTESRWAWADSRGRGGAPAANTAEPGRRRAGRPDPFGGDRHASDGRGGPQESGRCGGVAADADDAGHEVPESAAGRQLPARRPASDAEGDRRDEGRSGSAGLVGGPDAPVGRVAAAADADGERLAGRTELHSQPLTGSVGPLGRDDPHGLGVAINWGSYAPAIRRWEAVCGRSAPAPTITGARGNPKLNPAFVEWMMGLPAGWVTDVPGLSVNDQLKMLGNGVVPHQAAAALRWLLAAEQASVRGAA